MENDCYDFSIIKLYLLHKNTMSKGHMILMKLIIACMYKLLICI